VDKSRFGRENPRKSKEIQPSKVEGFEAKRRGAKKTQTDRSGPTQSRAPQVSRRVRAGQKSAPAPPVTGRSGRCDRPSQEGGRSLRVKLTEPYPGVLVQHVLDEVAVLHDKRNVAPFLI